MIYTRTLANVIFKNILPILRTDYAPSSLPYCCRCLPCCHNSEAMGKIVSTCYNYIPLLFLPPWTLSPVQIYQHVHILLDYQLSPATHLQGRCPPLPAFHALKYCFKINLWDSLENILQVLGLLAV